MTARSIWRCSPSFATPVTTASTTLARVESELGAIESPWLLPPVADQLEEFTGEVQGAGSATAVADAAVRHLPGILGADGPRRYLLLLGNPAESRDLGGHLGNWAELVVTDGKIDVTRVGVPYELFAPWTEPTPTLPDDDSLPTSLIEMQPERFPRTGAARPIWPPSGAWRPSSTRRPPAARRSTGCSMRIRRPSLRCSA